jgi:hypothetical protein
MPANKSGFMAPDFVGTLCGIVRRLAFIQGIHYASFALISSPWRPIQLLAEGELYGYQCIGRTNQASVRLS